MRQICWSPTAERLVISFTQEQSGYEQLSVCDGNDGDRDGDRDGDGDLDCDNTCFRSELVAVLSTSTHRGEMTKFAPIGFIRGPPSSRSGVENHPVHMSFKPHFDHGALLS